MDFWKTFLGGSAVVALIEAVRALVGWILNRKAAKEDRAEDRADKNIEERLASVEKWMEEHSKRVAGIEESLKLQKITNQFILMDRIRYLSRCFIMEGEITFEDRDILHQMHDIYHKNGGNGNLDRMMGCVDELPLKRN